VPVLTRRWREMDSNPRIPLVHRRPGGRRGDAKRGRTLSYMIPADARPSFDGHRGATFATVRGGAILPHVMRVNPENPGSTADFGCELCYCGPGNRDFTLKLLTPRISNLMNLERTQRNPGAVGKCGTDTCASARTR